MDNIEEAAQRIKKAIENNEKICVSVDVDADGCMSSAMLIRYLKNFTNNVTYTYHQRSQGHGIGNQFVDEDVKLLIICDSSTSETEVCQSLKEDCLDIIILDHHLKEKENPYAIIVNPQICDYPNKDLSGGGVVYKTLIVLDKIFNTDYHQQYIDMCGFAIYGDIMGMNIPENRFYTYQALKNIQNPGLLAILKAQGINPQYVDSSTIGYKIVPVVNAAARMEVIQKIMELLLEDDFDKCLVLAKECVKLNTERKNIEQKLFLQVKNKIDLSHNIIILKVTDDDLKIKGKEQKGFAGLIAMKIADRYKKPCLVLKCKDGHCSGSARSINEIPLKEILNSTGLLSWSQGHSGAFGLSIEEDKIEALYQALENKIVYNEDKIIQYDLEINLNDLDFDICKKINWFNYLAGKNAETTKVLIRNIPVDSRRVMGKGLDTVKLESDKLDLIKFRTNELYAENVDIWDEVDVIGTLNIGYDFQKKKQVIQLFIEDFKISEE